MPARVSAVRFVVSVKRTPKKSVFTSSGEFRESFICFSLSTCKNREEVTPSGQLVMLVVNWYMTRESVHRWCAGAETPLLCV